MKPSEILTKAKALSAMERRVLEKLRDCDGGHEITPSHPVTESLSAMGLIRLSNARCGPTEIIPDAWAKITEEGRRALAQTSEARYD